jgi:hypothetical protein
MENQSGQQQQQFLQAQQQYPWLTAQQYQGLVGGNYGQSGNTSQTGTSTSQGTQQGTMTGQQQQAYNSNPFGQALGGGIGLLGALGQAGGSAGIAGLFGGCDRNLKTDIEEIGKEETSGLPIYAFRYRGDPKTYPKVVGPMAQDIEAKYPLAVREMGGNLVIDLGALTTAIGPAAVRNLGF